MSLPIYPRILIHFRVFLALHTLNRGVMVKLIARWFRGRVVCALDYVAGDPGSMPRSHQDNMSV